MATGFKVSNPGCGCECNAPCGNLTITVRCGSFTGPTVPGATVSATLGGVSAGSATTNSDGVAVIPISSNGTYSVTVSKTGLVAETGGVVASGCTGDSITFTPAAAAGYSCTRDVCCAATQPAAPPYQNASWPTTVFLNDGKGSITLTGSAADGYYGTATRTATSASDCNNNFVAGPVLVRLYYALGCDGSLSVGYFGCGTPCQPQLPPAGSESTACNGGQCSGCPWTYGGSSVAPSNFPPDTPPTISNTTDCSNPAAPVFSGSGSMSAGYDTATRSDGSTTHNPYAKYNLGLVYGASVSGPNSFVTINWTYTT